MAYVPKVWVHEDNPLGPPADPGTDTPLDAAGLNDLEGRIGAADAAMGVRVEDVEDVRLPAVESGSPRLIVGKDNPQGLGNGTFDPVLWEYTEEEWHASMWDSAQRSRLVAPAWGLYRCFARVTIDSGGSGLRQLYTTMNGSSTWLDVENRPFGTGVPVSLAGEATVVLKPNDYVSHIVNVAGAGRSIQAGARGSLVRVAGVPYTRRIAVLGDSLSEGEDLTYGYVRALRPLIPTTHVMAQGNAGETAAQIAARVAVDVVAHTPEKCVVLAGTNSLNAAVSAASIQGSLTTIYDGLDAAGITAVVVTIPPSTSFDATEETVRQTVNTWIRGRGRPLVDADAVLRNPSSQAVLLPAYDAGDGLHLSDAGNGELAAAVAAVA